MTQRNLIDAQREALSAADWLSANAEKLLIGALVAAGIVGLMLIVRRIGRWLIDRDPDCRHWRGILGACLAKTTLFFMIATAVDTVVTYADVPARVERIADTLFIVAAALQAAIWARELIIGMVRSRVGDNPGATTLGNAMGLIRVLVSVAAFAIAIVVILDNLGVNVTALVAGLGIGGIAIGLAAQGIFSDLFAALAIVFDKPFRRGDVIRYGPAPHTTGTVEKIGMKTTRLRAISGEQVVMANTKLLEQELTNVADSRVRRVWLNFGIIYQTPPDTIEALPELMDAVLKPLKTCKLVRCVAKTFAASSIDCELVYDDRSTDADTLAKHRSAVMTGMMRAFAERKIEFAYPTQVAFTAAPDGNYVMPYPEVQQIVRVDEEPGQQA
jgi:small-conductance mechanosensitive channel